MSGARLVTDPAGNAKLAKGGEGSTRHSGWTSMVARLNMQSSFPEEESRFHRDSEVAAVAVSDVTTEGVEHALAEFDRLGRDAFLAQYGFGQAPGYFLLRDGRRYDCRAVVGVAHGYDRPDLGPLRPQDFAGSDATVAGCLGSLGFDVERPSRNPSWAEEELILALRLYLNSGLLDDANPAVVNLSRVLNALAVHSVRPDPVRFRNPNGVAMKLANFAAIDPNHRGRGMTRGGKRDAEVWQRYASDEDQLAVIAARIREGHGLLAAGLAEPTSTREVDVEAQHVEQFEVSVPGQVIEAVRREQSLVRAYVDHLESQGHRVTRHRYQLHGAIPSLVCDLVDETDDVLYEAKGDVRRSSVRMAIGQLLDYRRFESPSTRLAILLPRQPAQDLMGLIRSVPASAVWRTKDGFASTQPTAARIERLGGDQVPL